MLNPSIWLAAALVLSHVFLVPKAVSQASELPEKVVAVRKSKNYETSVGLVAHAKATNPEARFGAPPYKIEIEPRSKKLVYSWYGSHCQTVYKIVGDSRSDGLDFRLDLHDRCSICI